MVTNRPGAFVLPDATYDAYADRGESENRNKKLKTGLQADRLSDHRCFANLFRLYLHTAAYNLLVHMRHVVVDPPPSPSSQELPTEALAGRARRCWHNHRRQHDPLGEAQPCTWRTRLIKVAARIRQTTRRIVVELSAGWPYLKYFQQVSQRVLATARVASNTSWRVAKLDASRPSGPAIVWGKGGFFANDSSRPDSHPLPSLSA